MPCQPSPRFRVETWLPFRNCEMDYLVHDCSIILIYEMIVFTIHYTTEAGLYQPSKD